MHCLRFPRVTRPAASRPNRCNHSRLASCSSISLVICSKKERPASNRPTASSITLMIVPTLRKNPATTIHFRLTSKYASAPNSNTMITWPQRACLVSWRHKERASRTACSTRTSFIAPPIPPKTNQPPTPLFYAKADGMPMGAPQARLAAMAVPGRQGKAVGAFRWGSATRRKLRP
jgi:hypothetical protein